MGKYNTSFAYGHQPHESGDVPESRGMCNMPGCPNERGAGCFCNAHNEEFAEDNRLRQDRNDAIYFFVAQKGTKEEKDLDSRGKLRISQIRIRMEAEGVWNPKWATM